MQRQIYTLLIILLAGVCYAQSPIAQGTDEDKRFVSSDRVFSLKLAGLA